MVAKISNTLDKLIVTNYRMPSKEGEKPNPVISVTIQPRALLNDVFFPSESHKEEWLRQTKQLFDKGILIEGKVTEKLLINKNAENIQKENEMKKTKSDKTIGEIQEAADKINATIEFTEATGKEDIRNAKNRK